MTNIKTDLMSMAESQADVAKESKSAKQDGEKDKLPVRPLHDVYMEGKIQLEKSFGVQLVPDIGCKTTGFHKIYKLTKPLQELGLNYPNDFKHYRPITIDEYALVQSLWIKNITSLAQDVVEFWEPLFMPKTANVTAPLQLYTLQMLELQAIHDNQLSGTTHSIGISFKPNECIKASKWPRAFLPELDWFSDDIKNSSITVQDILSLFPKAEAELLALCFGRAVAGRTGHVPVGRSKPIEHTFRTMPVLFGAEPGQGKSTLANYIINALKYAGYTVANFNSMNSRFNLGSVISSHIAYKDDVTSEALEANLRADITKQAITNAQIRVEDKGTNAMELWSHAFFFTNVNKWSPSIVYKLDSGIMARVAMLATKFNIELKAEAEAKNVQSLYPFLYLPELAEKYNVSINTLILYFLRLCADMFLELIESTNKRALELKIKHLTSKLRCQFNDDITNSITSCMQISYMLRQKEPGNVFMPELTSASIGNTLSAMLYVAADLRAHDIRTKIKEDWEALNRPESHPWKAISRLKTASIDLARNVFRENREIYKQDINKLLKLVFTAFALKDGFNVGSGPVYITSAWQEARINQDKYKMLAIDIQKNVKQDVLDDLLTAGVDTSHLYTFEYDSQKQAIEKG